MPFKKQLSELQERLDWISSNVTRKTGADTNKQNPNSPIVEFGTNRIFIEIYTATKNAKGEIVYTYNKDVHAPDSKMLQLFGMVQNPYTTEAEGAIPAMVYNDVPKGNLNWSKTLYSPEPKVAVTKEIPDWTDGKVVEIIDKYKKQCAAGMFSKEAQKLKTEMLAEIEAHQGDLVKQLELIHHEMGDREDTEILLVIWRKKMETWMNEVKSLGEDCGLIFSFPDKCEDFQKYYDDHEKKCGQNALSKKEGDSLKALMLDCIKKSEDTITAKKAAVLKLKGLAGWEKDAKTLNEITTFETEITNLENAVKKQKEDMLPLKEECLLPIPLNILFKINSNKILEKDDDALEDIAKEHV